MAQPTINKGFNEPKEPQGQFITVPTAEASVPYTTVKSDASSADVRYFIKLLLLDTNNTDEINILKYIKVDPTIHITL